MLFISLPHNLSLKQHTGHIHKCCRQGFVQFEACQFTCLLLSFSSTIKPSLSKLILYQQIIPPQKILIGYWTLPQPSYLIQYCLLAHTNQLASIYLSVCLTAFQALLAAGGMGMELSYAEGKKASSSLLRTSLLNLQRSLPHTLSASCSNTNTRFIWFVVYLLVPDFKCCGLLLHCYYGIVRGCGVNAHKQQRELNKNKDTSVRAREKRTEKHKPALLYAFFFLQYICFAYITLLCSLLYRFTQIRQIQKKQCIKKKVLSFVSWISLPLFLS